jgi:purine nucleosidase
LHGRFGLGNWEVQVSDRQHQPASEKVIAELLRKHPNEITIVCLGPLTNVARLFQRDPAVIPLVDKLVISGGTVTQAGNATAVAEHNMFFDPIAARDVFTSATTKSLLPLDVTEQITFGVDLLDQLPPKYSRAGALLHQLMPFAFRVAHQKLGREMIPLYDPTTLLSVLEPDLFTWKEMAGRVETTGEFTRGATVFDRRLRPEWIDNMEVASDVQVDEVKNMLVRSLRFAGQQS